MIDKKLNQMDNLRKAIYIYSSGYATHFDWTLKDWFKAKEIVKSNIQKVSSIIHFKGGKE